MLLDRLYPHILLNMSCREVGMLHRNRIHRDACFQEKALDVHKLAHYLNVKYINGVLHHQHRPQGLSQYVDKVSFTQLEKLWTYLCIGIIDVCIDSCVMTSSDLYGTCRARR